VCDEIKILSTSLYCQCKLAASSASEVTKLEYLRVLEYEAWRTPEYVDNGQTKPVGRTVR